MSKLRVLKGQVENKKVRNATKVTCDGITFRSRLEGTTYLALKEAKIKADYEQNTYEIFPKFRFLGVAKRRITYTPDFVGSNFIIECKGPHSNTFDIKWKMFQYKLLMLGLENQYTLFIVHNKKELEAAITKIKNL